MQSEPLICGSSPRFPLSVSSLTAPHSQLSADAQPAQSPTVLAPPQTPAPASATSSTADLSCDLSSRSSKKKQTPISYAADRIIGSGSFGVVYEAKVLETGESVAIKKVRQDRRFKNRELEVMSKLGSLHPNVIALRHCFYSRDNQNQKNPDDLYLNLVMSYIPSTLYRSLRDHIKASRLVPMFYTRLYVWQMCRAVHYIHSMEICHRDIKPQNLLLFPPSAAATSTMFSPHQLLLCDFGSAKVLVPGEPNVSYICSRFYRAPELVFEATQYSASIDMWSVGAVFGELLLGSPLFPGESSVDQLIEIIKVLGTPTRDEIIAMNKLNSVAFKFPVIQPAPLTKVFKGKAPDDAMDLITHFLKYDPKLRIHPLDALAHPFFDPLRVENAGSAANAGTTKDVSMPPKLFQFTEEEITTLKNRGIYDRVVPPQYRHYPPLQPLAVRIGGSQQSASAPTPSSSSAAAQHASPASHLTSTSLNPVAVASA